MDIAVYHVLADSGFGLHRSSSDYWFSTNYF